MEPTFENMSHVNKAGKGKGGKRNVNSLVKDFEVVNPPQQEIVQGSNLVVALGDAFGSQSMSVVAANNCSTSSNTIHCLFDGGRNHEVTKKAILTCKCKYARSLLCSDMD